MFKILAAMAPLSLAACNSYDIQPYGTFDGSQKTITVSRGGGGLSGYLKTALRKEGWKMAVDRGAEVTESTVTTEGARSERFDTFKTRYRMGVHSQYRDVAIEGGTIYVYDISIVDNETGEEILTMTGRGVDYEIAKRLLAAIKENSR